MIDKKYHDFLNKSSILYDEEECQKCKEMREKTKKLNDEISNADEEDEIKLKKKLNVFSKTFTLHKKQHENLNFDDIETIMIEFDDYCSKL